MQTSSSNNGMCTANLQAAHEGWLRKVRLSWGIPQPLDYASAWPTSTVIDYDGGPIVNATVTLKSSDNGTNAKTIFTQTINCPYNYGGVTKEFTTEVDYGSAKTFELIISNVKFLYIDTETNGIITTYTSYTTAVDDTVTFRQGTDTQSWGSDDEKSLFIPFEDPFPDNVSGVTNILTTPSTIAVNAVSGTTATVLSTTTTAAQYGGLQGLQVAIPATSADYLVVHMGDAALGNELSAMTNYTISTTMTSDARCSVAAMIATQDGTGAASTQSSALTYDSQFSALTAMGFTLETISSLPTDDFSAEGLNFIISPTYGKLPQTLVFYETTISLAN